MLLDIVVIVLLCMTVIFCWRLNSKMIEIKDSRKDLKKLVQALDGSIIQTHKSLAALKDASVHSSNQLDHYLKVSQELINDLSFMTDSASKIADRLDSSISVAKVIINEKNYIKSGAENINDINSNDSDTAMAFTAESKKRRSKKGQIKDSDDKSLKVTKIKRIAKTQKVKSS